MQSTYQILTKLQLFGLNPNHWSLSLQFHGSNSPLSAHLIRKNAPEVQLAGKCYIRNKGPQLFLEWLDLSVV